MSNVNQKTFSPQGRFLLALLAAAGIAVGGYRVAEFNSAGKLDPAPANSTVLDEPFNAFVTKTGSVVIDYPATCIENPGKALGLSGATLNKVELQVADNPASIEGELVFTPDCASTVNSGTLLANLDDVCSSSGCTAKFGSGSGLKWFKDDKLKLILKGNPTSGYNARVRGNWSDNYAY